MSRVEVSGSGAGKRTSGWEGRGEAKQNLAGTSASNMSVRVNIRDKINYRVAAPRFPAACVGKGGEWAAAGFVEWTVPEIKAALYEGCL